MDSKLTNSIAESFAREYPSLGCSFLDGSNILWQLSNNKWIGKRSVYTNEKRTCWLEETAPENVKIWWCGKDADYSEVFN
jgi:hypothetical protein